MCELHIEYIQQDFNEGATMKKKLILFILIVLIPVFAWASGRIVFMSPGTSTDPDNYFRWQMGSSSVISSTGSDVTVRWGLGAVQIWHKN